MAKVYHGTDFFSESDYREFAEAFKSQKEIVKINEIETPNGNYEICLFTYIWEYPTEHWEASVFFNYANRKNGIGGFSISPCLASYDLFIKSLEDILVKYDDCFEYSAGIQQSLF